MPGAAAPGDGGVGTPGRDDQVIVKHLLFLVNDMIMLKIPTQAYRKPGPEDSDSLQPS